MRVEQNVTKPLVHSRSGGSPMNVDTDARDLAIAIAAGIRAINAGTGDIISGLICDDLSVDDQLRFAHQLVGVAELLRCRVTGESAPVSVVDGAAPDEALHRPATYDRIST